MITERYIERASDGRILFRIAVSHVAVFDVLTDEATLESCRQLLRNADDKKGMQWLRMGSFGPFDVSMTVSARETVSLLIDGPELDNVFHGHQGAGIYISREEMSRALNEEKDWSTRHAMPGSSGPE